jgi:hypothetical protein
MLSKENKNITREAHLFDTLPTKMIYEISPNIVFDFFVSIHPFTKDHVQKQTFIQDFMTMYFISKNCLSIQTIEHITIKIRVVIMFMLYFHLILFFINNVFLDLIKKTKKLYVLLALYECLSTTNIIRFVNVNGCP